MTTCRGRIRKDGWETPRDEVQSLTPETEGSEWDNAAGCSRSALDCPAGTCMIEVGSNISLAYAQDSGASTVADMQDFERYPANWTGNKQCDRGVLIVVDGSAYDASGVGHISRCCHLRSDSGKKSKIDAL